MVLEEMERKIMPATTQPRTKNSPILEIDLKRNKAKFSDIIEPFKRDRTRTELKRLGIWIKKGKHLSVNEVVLGKAGAKVRTPDTTVAAVIDAAEKILREKPGKRSKDIFLTVKASELVLRFRQ